MKKIFLLLLGCLVLHQGTYGQAKQRKELLLQIAALQVYMDYAKKGYSVVSKGLNFIGDARKGEVQLHGDYFSSLIKINPKVRSYYKTTEIVALQIRIMKTCKKTYSDLRGSDLFHGNELDYITRSFERLLANCNAAFKELLVVVNDSQLELKDDQRIARIDALHQSMLEDYSFCVSFSDQAKLLALARAADKSDVRTTASWYGLIK